MKSWSDIPNVMTPYWVTDFFEFVRKWSIRMESKSNKIFKIQLVGLFIKWDRPKAEHISK